MTRPPPNTPEERVTMSEDQRGTTPATSSSGELSIDLRVRIVPDEARAEVLIDDGVVWWAETRQDPSSGLFGVFASDDRLELVDDPISPPFDHFTQDSAAASLARFSSENLDSVVRTHVLSRFESVNAVVPELPFRVVFNRIADCSQSTTKRTRTGT